VGADPTVAVTIERGGVAAGPAISLTGDEIDEPGILDLLHLSLSRQGERTEGLGGADRGW
jgi:hypothetical protein